MPDLRKLTPRQNAQYHYMMDVMRRFEWDMHNRIEMSGRIPPEWHEIVQGRPDRTKSQVNIGLDEDVLKFFRSLGKGYGARINLVLKSFMHARLAGVLEGPETLNHFKTRTDAHAGDKPQFGDVSRDLGEDWDDGADPATLRKARGKEALRKFRADEDAGG